MAGLPPRPAAMKDVARAVGLHQTTVSRALRNDPRIPESTRKRIREAALQLKYRPHPLVSALIAVRRSRQRPRFPITLAFLAYGTGLGRNYQPHQYSYEPHLAGARSAAEQQGYAVQLFPLNTEGMTIRRLNDILAARNVPGVIIGSLPEADSHFTLDWDRFCTVAIEYTFTQTALDRIVHDSYDGMRRIMAECRARGLCRIGLMLTAAGDQRTEFLNGAAFWREQKADAHFAPIMPLTLPAWDANAFTAWHRRYRPEVVVTSNALLPELLRWCERRRLRIGGDISIANVNALLGSAMSGIYQDPFVIGATAARMVIEKISRNDRGLPDLRHTILTAGRWIEGTVNSLRPRAAVAAPAPIGRKRARAR